MSILIICPGKDPKPWVEALKNQLPRTAIYVYPEDHNKEEVEYAITWKHPHGIFKYYPNLKVIASMGAGVDHIISDSEIPKNISITRIVDEQLAEDMSVFVLALVMDYLRNISCHFSNQNWKPKPYKKIKDEHIGILGLGVLGKAVANMFKKNCFMVLGWAKSPKQLEGIKTYTGAEQLEEFLNQCTILICLLPLTKETENILNKDLFTKLPQGAYVINVARGQHLVEQDLLEMVNNGHLSGAALDVFREEPLPIDHSFWKHPKIHVTPHIASVTNPLSVVPQLVQNYERMKKGEELENVVDRRKGY